VDFSVGRYNVHHHTKFHKKRLKCCRFFDFQDGAVRCLRLLKFRTLYSCQGPSGQPITVIFFLTKSVWRWGDRLIEFNGFQNGDRPTSWISTYWIFQRSIWCRGQICATLQNFIEIGLTVANKSRLFDPLSHGMQSYGVLEFLEFFNFDFFCNCWGPGGENASP